MGASRGNAGVVGARARATVARSAREMRIRRRKV